jgi:hypothetical protein
VLFCFGNRHGHTAVFEGTGGVHALKLHEHTQSRALRKVVGFNQWCPAFAERDHRGGPGHIESISVFVNDATPLAGTTTMSWRDGS